ncbi:MAG: glutathione synthase [Deltaproteobacteria bacterium]|nr:glutathione synthase [Deltaproteobacteria bacterium]
MLKKLSFGFVADPLDSFDREAETTLFLMREVARLGGSIFVCEAKDLFLKQNEVWGRVKKIEMTENKHCFYRILKETPLNLKTLDCLFLRKDPPFDMAYLKHLWLLEKLEKKVLMVNRPSAIIRFNEKLSSLDFPFAPNTLVSSCAAQILEWSRKFSKGIVLKPLNLSGGLGICWFKKTDIGHRTSDIEKKIKQMTADETEPVIAQEYLSAAKIGDKRILLWDGKILGGFLRIPRAGEFRANLHQGGHFVKTVLTSYDKKIATWVGKWAKKEGLYFVGLDVIGRHLTEINVTSPMGIREVNVLYGLQVERNIIGALVKRI